MLARRPSHSLLSFLLQVAVFALFPRCITGQTSINGQTFTNGLAIIDAPGAGNPGHAGSDISIAIEVSGDGKLTPAASVPGSEISTRYDSLEIYLVSAQTNINITVSTGPSLLTNESGSTVKHLNWPIPTCIPAGDYNLTFYEASHLNGQGVFTITPIPIPISNPSASGQCENLNSLQPQPQSSNPLSQSPFVSGSTTSPSSSKAGTISGGPTSALALTLTLLFLAQIL